MDKITLDFEQAKTKHLLFKSKLRAILYGEVMDEAPVVSHFECGVGQWIYGRALKEYSHIPQMAELEQVHENIHTSAKKLVELYKAGKVEEARSGLSEMEAIADKLIGLLDTLEKKIHQNVQSHSVTPDYQPAEVTLNELQELVERNNKLDKIIKEQSGELMRERKLLRDFFNQALGAFALLKGPNHVFELINPGYQELIGGRSPIGLTLKKALPELEGQGFYELMDHVYNTGETYTGKETMASIIRSGKLEHIYVNFSYQAFRDHDGNIEGILVCAYEVTEQVKARKLIEESEEKYRDLANAMPDVVWTATADGNMDFCNKKWMDYTGFTFEETKDWKWQKVIHPDDLEQLLEKWKHSIKTGEAFESESRWLRHDKQYRWHLSRGFATKNRKGEIVKWIGTATNIHKQKELQLQLQQAYDDLESKVKFRNIELERENVELKDEINRLKKS